MEDRDASTTTPIIDETMCFLLDSAERGQNLGKQRPPSICKVPRILRDLSEKSFNPQLVSIGPIHREDPKLQEFEWLKECYLNDLLNRCDSPKKILEACLREVNGLITKIRESYDGVIKNYSDVELARMMVMDGCFILEFCFKHEEEDLYLPNKMQNLRIAMDLMLLENQVPFFVLQALFNCFTSYADVKETFTLSQVLDNYLAPYVKLFCSRSPEKISTTDVDSDSTHHVLGYLHKRYHAEELEPHQDEEGIGDASFHSIVELDRSGMNFKPHQKDIWSMTIEVQSSLLSRLPWFWVCCTCCCCCCCCCLPCLPWFCSKRIVRTLQMPTLLIDDFTELILRNFIAYEQSFLHKHHRFTSYAFAMDKLIDTQEDIAKLVESKVLVNMLGTNQEAADMINKVRKNIGLKNFCYTKEFKKMDKYCNRFWPKNIAKLRRIYFSNPWSAIALFAAIILFSLTVVQTVYTIMGT